MTTTPTATSYLPPLPANAQLFQRAVTNPIGVTASTAVNVGWLNANEGQLEIVGQLTGSDPVDMYKFTFQQGSELNLNVTNIDGSVNQHIQLLDASGSRVIADNQGNATTKAAFAQLTSSKGLERPSRHNTSSR